MSSWISIHTLQRPDLKKRPDATTIEAQYSIRHRISPGTNHTPSKCECICGWKSLEQLDFCATASWCVCVDPNIFQGEFRAAPGWPPTHYCRIGASRPSKSALGLPVGSTVVPKLRTSQRQPAPRRIASACSCTRRSPAATMRPPSRAGSPSQVVTTPPAASMMGTRGTMS